MKQIITIAGMHRSGTSLTANWLKACGLNIGDKLMHGGFDNPQGHYEDLEILNIHEQDLKRKRLSPTGLRLKGNTSFKFDSESNKNVHHLLENRESLHQWGWKEPRTTLYLNEWKKLIPDLKVIAIYRPAHEVIDSLTRRITFSINSTNKYKTLNRLGHKMIFPFYIKWERSNFIDAWVQYNRAIINFYTNYPEDTIICSLDSILKNSGFICNKIIQNFNFQLDFFDIQDLFKKDMLKTFKDSKKEGFYINDKRVHEVDQLINRLKLI